MTKPAPTGSLRNNSDRICRFRPVSGGGFRAAIEVTRRCHLQCPHCFVPPQPLDLPLTAITWLIEELKQEGCRKILITGGEPLLRADLEAIVRTAAAAGIGVDLNSTLVGLTAERAGALVEAGLTEASVSFYGDRKFHDAFVRRRGCYAATLSACLSLRDLRVELDVHGPVWGANLRHATHLLELAERIGAASLTFFKIVKPLDVDVGAWLSSFPDPPESAFTGILDELRMRASLPIRTVGFHQSADELCEQSCSIVGIDAALRLSPCLLSRSRNREPAVIRQGGLGEALRLLRAEVQCGDWQPWCDQDVQQAPAAGRDFW
jgi:sulfatase maturation enzyme AslB (radical SAM superfamily)